MVDIGLRPTNERLLDQLRLVSILVVVDIGLRPDDFDEEAFLAACLNPCCGGYRSATPVRK